MPEVIIDEKVMTVPGTDGRKMSKSYHNTIDIFLPEKELKKVVMSNIITDAKSLEEPKDPDTCNVFALYNLLGDETQVKEMRKKYLGGNYGYGHAKKELLELILDGFSNERDAFSRYMSDTDSLEKDLLIGANKAKTVAQEVLGRVRSKLGYRV